MAINWTGTTKKELLEQALHLLHHYLKTTTDADALDQADGYLVALHSWMIEIEADSSNPPDPPPDPPGTHH